MSTVAEVNQEIDTTQDRLETEEEALGLALAEGKDADAIESRCAGLRTLLRQLDLKRDAAQRLADEKQAKADDKQARKLTKQALEFREWMDAQGAALAALVEQMEAIAGDIRQANAIRDWQMPIAEAHKLGADRAATQPARLPLPDRGGLEGRARAAAGVFSHVRDDMASRATRYLR